jgi:hypothetical protein
MAICRSIYQTLMKLIEFLIELLHKAIIFYMEAPVYFFVNN